MLSYITSMAVASVGMQCRNASTFGLHIDRAPPEPRDERAASAAAGLGLFANVVDANSNSEFRETIGWLCPWHKENGESLRVRGPVLGFHVDVFFAERLFSFFFVQTIFEDESAG
jgi:hypothetical protein